MKPGYSDLGKKNLNSQRIRRRKRRQLSLESLEFRRLLFGLSWNNVLNPINADGDASNSPLDALVIINEINQPRISGPGGTLPVAGDNGKLPPPYFDVDCDSRVSPLDVLSVINVLNGGPSNPSWTFEQLGGSGASTGSYSAAACSPMLHEGNSFITSLTSEVTIPANANSLTFEYTSLDFDLSSKGRALDSFEAALLDAQGNSLVHTLASDRDSFFNIAEGLPVAKTEDVTQDSSKISLSLVDVLPSTKARLVLRLVNNDGDSNSSVIIPAIRFENLPTRPSVTSRPAAASSNNSPSMRLNSTLGPMPAQLDESVVGLDVVFPRQTGVSNQGESQILHSSGKSDAGSSQSSSLFSSKFESRGKEFWVAFPDNLFEGNNRPQKVLYITGDVATTGVVDIPGLVDPTTSLAFHRDIAVNPGTVTVVELPSMDVGDNNDNETDFDVEAELIARVQRKGIHVVTQDPVTVYGLDLAVSTSDAFLALPVSALGTEYINLGYENTSASISHVEGTQYLVLATQDNTLVTLATGPYSGASSISSAQVRRPNGTSEFNLFNGNGQDIGPFVIDAAGMGSVVVSPPFDGYAGQYNFELIDMATAAVGASFDEKVALSFPTGRESKVISYDVVAGQRLYFDAIYSNSFPGPSLNVQLISPSGIVTGLSPQNDNNSFVNLFGALQFQETGKYYILVVGENASAFNFAFRLVNMDTAPKITFGTTYSGTSDPSGRAEVYRFDASAGEVFFFDSMNPDRNVGFTVLGPGGQNLFSVTASDDSFFVVPESATYSVVVDSSAFRVSSFAFRLLSLKLAAALPLNTATTFNIAGGRQTAFRFEGATAQTFNLDVQNLSPFFRATYRLLDPAGKDVPLTQVGNRLSGKLLVDGNYSFLIGALTVQEGGDIQFMASLAADPVVTKSGLNTTQTISNTPGTTATYQFTAPAGTRILVDSLDITNENLYVLLNAPNGERLFTGFGSANEQQDIPRFGPGVLTQSGTYTMTLGGNTATAFGSYSFRVLDLDTAGIPLTLGSTVMGNFPTGREAVVYTFDASAGDKLLFDGITGSYIFGIYSASLDSIYSAGIFGAAPASQVDGIGRVVQSGRHYVVFQGDPNIPQDFQFSITNLSATPLLPVGQEIAGIVPGNSMVNKRLPLTAGQRIRIDHLLPFATEVSYRIANAGGRVLTAGDFTNSDSGPPGNRLITVPESDEYIFSIQSRQATPASFRFRIDDLGAIPLLTFDTDQEVTLNPGNAAQVFRIEGNAGETIQVDNLGQGLPLNWEITGPTTQFRGGSNDGLDFSATILNTGTHYFALSGRQNSGPITVRFRAIRTPGPVVQLAGFNTVVTLDVGINETKTYSYSAPVGRLVYLNVQKSEFKIPNHSVSLNQGETYLVRDLNGNFGAPHDLTGSIITSTKPVAVFGGNRASFVPSEFFAADHLVEQLPPTNTWGSEFVTLPLKTDSTRGDRFRYLAQADNTVITVNGTIAATLNRGQFFEQVVTGPGHIVSSKPILVAQYAHSQNYYRTNPGGNANFLGDPLMMIVPPYEQFLANYTISTPDESSILNAQRFDRNFINIVAPEDAIGTIELNGSLIAANLYVPIGTSGFVGAQVPVELGAYSLAGPVPFGVFVYGFGSFDSYGYVGGQSLSPVASVGSVVLTPSVANPQVNNLATFNARVADVTGSPLEGIRVDFSVDGVNPQRGFGFTDNDGRVAFNYTGTNSGRDIVTASVGQLLDDSVVDWRADAIAPIVFVASPSHLSSVPAGTMLVATGTASADFPFATIDLITVNGAPINNVDAAGNFFVTLYVGPGESEYEFSAIDSNGRVGTQVIRLTGTQQSPSQADFSQFADVSGSFRETYARSSFNQFTTAFHAEIAIENIGQYPTDVPLLVSITNLSDPSVLVRSPDGYTPNGDPYYDYTGLVTGGTLSPKSKTGLLDVQFFNPNRTQFTYDLVFYGKLNQPPQIFSLPTTQAELNREYQYDVIANDPNGEAVSFALLESPPGMTINTSNGQIRWMPSSDAAGLHSVEIQVSDTRLGTATQRFVLSAVKSPANRTPIVSSIPDSLAEVGKAYSFSASAVDADGDRLQYQLSSSPSGMAIDTNTGLVTWTPTSTQLGTHAVVMQINDGHGGSTEQSFALLVVSPMDNAAPVILNNIPGAIKLAAWEHSVVARDAENEVLSYRLVRFPSGMTIDISGVLHWTPTSAQLGVHEVALEVVDIRGGRAFQNVTLAVLNNMDPVITSQPSTNAQVNAQYSYQITASDSVDDVLSYRLLDAPTGMTIHPSTGLVSWTPNDQAYSQERVSIQVSDGRGGLAEQSFAIVVMGGRSLTSNQNPFFVTTPPTHATVGATLLYHAQARDPNEDLLVYDLPLAPDGMVINTATGTIGWQPNSSQSGSQTIVVRVKDAQGSIGLQSFLINVDESNTAPVISSLPILNASLGNIWEYRIHVQDADADALMFELNGPPAGMTITQFDQADADAVIRFTPISVGVINVGLMVRDNHGGQVLQQLPITVTASTPNLAPAVHSLPRTSIPVGQTWVYLLDISDENGDSISISLPTAPAGMVLDSVSRILQWTPTVSQLGSNNVVIQVSDGRGGITNHTFAIQAVVDSSNHAPEIVSPPSASRATVGDSFVYNVRASDADNDSVEWSLFEAPHGTSIDARYGTLRWTPTLEDLGLQRFIVSAKDPSGLEAHQSFSILVSGANLGPSILSRAPSEAVADERYVYGVRAVDVENDRLTYSLTNSPSGMTIDDSRGIIRWTPTIGQLGTASATVQVVDSNGNATSQKFTINVSQLVRNQEPIIQSRAVFRARVDALYQYDVNAIDPEGDTITYSLVSAPPGMQIDAASGVITWTPAAVQTGSHLVQVAAQDANGGRGLQRFAILARVNQAPSITSAAITHVALGGLYQYDVQSTDPDGDALGYELVTGPVGMTMDALGRIVWQTAPGVATQHTVGLRVVDAYGGFTTQSFTLNVTPDTTAPRIALRSSANPLALGQDSVIVVQVSDNVGVVEVGLTINGSPWVLDTDGSVTFRGQVAGLYSLVATARDASGNLGTDSLELRVFDPADTRGPMITITSPSANTTVTSLADIVGSVTDDNLQFYRIDYGRADLVDVNQPTVANPAYRTLAQGNVNAVDKVLATFDPTMLINDDYVIRILAQDLSGNVSTKVLPVQLDGQLKLGEFKLDFTDLTIPLAGIPITITRTYDTRNANESGDFGYGWTLSVSDSQIRETLPVNPLEEEGLFFAATPFRDGTKVYLTNPEGRRVGFTFRPTRQFSLFGGGSYAPTFVPDPGVYDSLDVGSLPLRKIGDAYYSGFFGDPFNPSAYRLTTKQGVVYEYGQFSGLDNVTDRNGNRLEFRPDGVFSSTGASIQFVRDPQGRIERIIDPAGNATQYHYDSAGNLRQYVDRSFATTRFEYEVLRNSSFLKQLIDPLGNIVFTNTYDVNGRLIKSTDVLGNFGIQTYDATNRTVRITDARGNTYEQRLNERGNIVQAVNKLGKITTYTYSDIQNPDLETQIIDPLGRITSNQYDANGNRIAIIDALGNIQSFKYNEVGDVLQETDSLGRAKTYVIDEVGNPTVIVDAQGNVSLSQYDDQGRLTMVEDAIRRKTILNYDADLLPREIRRADGSVVVFHYDALGRTTSQVNALGRATHIEYDESSRPIATRIEEQEPTRYVYDQNGRLLQILDARGVITTNIYDALGRLIRSIDKLGGETRSEYDALGNRISETDRNGGKRTFEYDSESRLTKERWWNNASVVEEITYRYDDVGNITSVSDSNAIYEFGYDLLNRMTRVQGLYLSTSTSFTMDYVLDAEGNPIAISDEQGVKVFSNYDEVNRLVERSWERSLNKRESVQFAFDPSGRLNDLLRFNDVSEPTATIRTNYLHDDLNNILQIRSVDKNGVVLEERQMTYDSANRIATESEAGELTSYTYDVSNQLRLVKIGPVPVESYTYDSRGNRTSATNSLGQHTYQTAEDNRLESDESFDYQYDPQGNLVLKTDRVSRVVTQYQYDHRQRLIIAIERSQGGVILHESRFTYDALDRRIEATYDGTREQTVYDGANPWKDIDAANRTILARYLYGMGTDQLLARFNTTSGFGWYTTNQLGSVIGILSESANFINRKSYDSYGIIISETGIQDGDRFGFTGREHNSIFDLIYLRARYYDPRLGRFMSQDPLRYDGFDSNFYRYVGNNPLGNTDRTGRIPGEEKPPALPVLKTLGNKISRARNYRDLWDCMIQLGFNPLKTGAGGIGGGAAGLAAGGVEGAAVGAAIGGLIGAMGDLADLIICLEKIG